MDLRTIMNNDASGTSDAPPTAPPQSPSQVSRKPSDPMYAPRDQQRTSSYPSAYSSHPPQPPPLQRPHASPERSSSYGSLQSPYQYHPPSAQVAGAQSQRGPSPPPYGSSASRDSFSTYGHPQQQPQQQQSPFAQQRSQSIQSVLTPSSTSTYSFHPRESPPAAASQSYPSQQFPPPAQGSVPNTPRGLFLLLHPIPVKRPHRRALNPPAMNPYQIVPRARGPLEQTPRQNSSATDRRDSDESVSPKTAFPSGSRQGSTAGYTDLAASSQPKPTENGVSLKESSPNRQTPQPAPAVSNFDSSPPARKSLTDDSSAIDQVRPLPTKMDLTPDARTNSSPQAPRVKRRRYEEPPIYARRSVRTKGRIPMIPNRCPPIPKHARNSTQNPFLMRQQNVSAQASAADSPAKPKSETPPVNGPSAPRRPPEPAQAGSLGPWEPSIYGYIPHEEVTKAVCDFLFQHVVMRNDASAAPAGTAGTGQGAMIEVEAKLGQLVDMDRGERLLLPISTEGIVNKENTRLRTAFESTMTLAQHRAMNNFLNEAVKMSMPQANPGRIPLSYAHKKERDTFYEISPSELPPVIRQNLNPRHKPKVRVTLDQRTGEVLAKIVKCRIADLDVYSPRTCVDWRISVNLEMSYEGDVSHLTVVDPGRGRGGERNKDRMSYRHLAYQIDLTQVAKSEPQSKGEFEHELEVEISAAEIRRQGQLAMAGDPKNQYEELVKGFVDNIRILARAVPP
ncbi:putative mRNA capping nucleoside-triphosphatase [Aspergillus nomiae NRRL 13137]|uniref:mRNA-capping enzyme subunit beta n=1 Tax=Aspergillus nomiae NRRL (strain ATCC 15546 / NRRL 13137 / CBS 260.88 / M93) TaxID=1509407 RepID=A0A0L1ITW7_ASPN3|nr:putative mRNA capping nucleoside-triphosphatase [Aspergillus nomiae NRRL 13137]KNG82855.1 putative mRNA capping nucleoside-triphosphatase [Aspergillus nomiae NRRL 13137]